VRLVPKYIFFEFSAIHCNTRWFIHVSKHVGEAKKHKGVWAAEGRKIFPDTQSLRGQNFASKIG
jgi:hypothetical protein